MVSKIGHRCNAEVLSFPVTLNELRGKAVQIPPPLTVTSFEAGFNCQDSQAFVISLHA